jgi:hypothetical protein
MLYFARGIEAWQRVSAARVYRTDLVRLPIAAAAAAAAVVVVVVVVAVGGQANNHDQAKCINWSRKVQ